MTLLNIKYKKNVSWIQKYSGWVGYIKIPKIIMWINWLLNVKLEYVSSNHWHVYLITSRSSGKSPSPRYFIEYSVHWSWIRVYSPMSSNSEFLFVKPLNIIHVKCFVINRGAHKKKKKIIIPVTQSLLLYHNIRGFESTAHFTDMTLYHYYNVLQRYHCAHSHPRLKSIKRFRKT